jgi:hypothetical protein
MRIGPTDRHHALIDQVPLVRRFVDGVLSDAPGNERFIGNPDQPI